jgi:hypothetical protein
VIGADAGWVVDRIVAVANNILIDANQRNADHERCKVNGSDNASAEIDDILAFALTTAPHTCVIRGDNSGELSLEPENMAV